MTFLYENGSAGSFCDPFSLRAPSLEAKSVIDISTETLLTLQQARSKFPHRPDLSTVYRFCLHGCRGVSLRYMRVGRRVITSVEALNEFTRALTELDSSGTSQPATPKAATKPRPPARRKRSIDRAEAVLARARI